MKRGPLIVGVLVVGGAVGAAVALDPAARVQGWVRGEPFFAGKAASAWAHDLRQPDVNTAAAAQGALVAGKGHAVAVCGWVLEKGADAPARFRAADALGQIGKPAAVTAGPTLVAALKDADPLVRGVAARALGELAPDVPGALPALVAAFPDVDALRAVAKFGPAGADAVPAVVPLMKHADLAVRWNAARVLIKVGPGARAAVPDLIAAAHAEPPADDDKHLLREHACEALGAVGPADAAVAIPVLVKYTSDPVGRVRRDSVRSLGMMGPLAKDHLSRVKELTADPDEDVKEAATKAVRQIDPTVTDKK